jgi:protein-S-isoprenylcysteine O-methyltransferase Ste14
MSQEPLWKAAVAACILLLFAAAGVYAVFRPDPFVPRPLFWKQGDMERTMNRDGVRVFGAIFAAVALWILYSLLS